MEQLKSPFDILLSYQQRVEETRGELPIHQAEQSEWSGLSFKLGLYTLAIAMTEVEEIVDLPDYAVVPNTKPWFIGIGNVRGQLIPMTNLHHFAFGQPMDKDDHARLLVCMREEVRVGLLVGEVLGLRRFYAAERQATSDGLHPILNQFADGTFGRGDDCCSVIDMQQLMGNREFLEIGN